MPARAPTNSESASAMTSAAAVTAARSSVRPAGTCRCTNLPQGLPSTAGDQPSVRIECFTGSEAGLAVAEICRKGGFSDATFYKWRAKFGGMEASDARRLRELEAENSELKSLLAEAHLDMHALKSVLGVKR